jgi:putative endonuclease
MKTVSQQLGQAAEDFAVRYLKKGGFAIIARNYRYQRAEIDIIAQKNELLVFVEVKARSNNQFGDPETFVTPRQQALVRAAAEHYIMTEDWNHDIRFDIVSVLQHNDNQPQLTHFEDAF